MDFTKMDNEDLLYAFSQASRTETFDRTAEEDFVYDGLKAEILSRMQQTFAWAG